MARNGFSLIELMMATMLLTAALAMIWQVWLSAQDTVEVLGRKMTATEASIHGMGLMQRELRQASRASISPLPAASLTYRVVEERPDGGSPLDETGAPRLSEPRTITRDIDDANGDGIGESQLVLITAEGVTVLANGLPDATGPDPSVPDGGIWFEADGDGIRVRLVTSGKTRRKLELTATAETSIVPRNP